MSSFGEIKEKLKTIFNGEETLLFLNNITKPLGNKSKKGMIISRQDSLNCFLENIFRNNDEIFIEHNYSNNCTNNLIIKNKKIIVRTAGDNCKEFTFCCFGYTNSIDRILEKVKFKKEETDYVLLILINRNRPNENFRVSYNFYLKSMRDFSLNNDGKRNWRTRANSFNFLFDKENLGSSIFSYSHGYDK